VRRKSGALLVAAVLCAGASLFLVFDHTREDSLSADEPVHILAGHLLVTRRNAIVNIEHPPLMKALSGIGLSALSLPEPLERVPLGDRFTVYGHAFLFENRVSPDAIAAAARAPFLLLLLFLLLLVFLASARRYGATAGLFAMALLALDPNLLAHAGVVHTDLGAALFFPAVVLAWEAARRRPSLPRLGGVALLLGLALATKFSMVYLFPILLLQSLLASRREPRPGAAAGRGLLRLAAASAGALGVVFLLYAALSGRTDPAEQRQVIHEMVALRGAPRLSAALESLTDVSPPLAHYLGGLASVARQNVEGGGVNYLLGRVSVHGFPHYFLVAFLAKSTLALLAIGTLLVVRLFRRDAAAREEARLFLLPVGVLFLASIGSSYNIGIRHLLPVYPFLALAAAGPFARSWARRSEGGRRLLPAVVLAALPLLCAAEVLRIHPHELSYFNPLVGGPERGRRILSDSNVDWGLDLKRLARELERRGVANPTVVYFGGDDVLYRLGVPDFSAEPRVRGDLIAISAFHLAVGPEFYTYHGARQVASRLENLRRRVTRALPVGRVGYSILLFELPREIEE
jgi:hypothetical protein